LTKKYEKEDEGGEGLFLLSSLHELGFVGSSVLTLKSVPEGISENFRFLSFGAYSSTEGKSKVGFDVSSSSNSLALIPHTRRPICLPWITKPDKPDHKEPARMHR